MWMCRYWVHPIGNCIVVLVVVILMVIALLKSKSSDCAHTQRMGFAVDLKTFMFLVPCGGDCGTGGGDCLAKEQ